MTNRNSLGRAAILAIVALAAAANLVLVTRYMNYANETERLREGMTKAQRDRADAVIAAEQHRMRVEFELIRRQARGDNKLHLAVNVDSGNMVLERDGIVLREMRVRLSGEAVPGTSGDSAITTQMLGLRTIERLLDAGDTWNVPRSVFAARGEPAPENTRIRGALGERAILLNDGTVVYAVPDDGPLADSAVVLPGSVQVDSADLKALAANIRPGMSVYFYR